MTAASPLVPKGISHAPDIAGLPPDARRAHHRRALQSIAFHRGIDGVAEYKLAHPDAAPIRVNMSAVAYAPKPRGYADAMADTVTEWFRSEAALAASNRADVDRLNSHFGQGRFHADTHFSKPLPASLRQRIAKVFQDAGATLPPAAQTMSAVRQAVRAFKAQSLSGARPFGSIGTRTDDMLTIGGQSYAISTNGKRECIRFRLNGEVRRLYLDDVLAIANLLAAPSETPAITYYVSNIGECDYSPETVPHDPLRGVEIGECDYSPGDCDYSLSERIRRLAAANRQAPALPTGRDPLELDGPD